MPIEFRCVQCQKLLRTPDGTDGKRVKCPSCATEMRVPTVTDAAGGGAEGAGTASSGFSETLPHSGSGSGGIGGGGGTGEQGGTPFGTTPPPPPPPIGGGPQPSDSPFGAAPTPPAGDFENPYQAPLTGELGADAGYPAGAYRPTVIDIGDVLGRAWTIFRAQMWNCVIPGLVIMGVSIGLTIVTTTVVAVVAAATDELTALFANIGSQILSNLVSIWLNVGMVIYFLNLGRGRQAELGDLFRGGPYMLRAVGATILFVIAFYVGIVLCIVPGVYFALRYGLFMAAIVDRDTGVLEGFSTSAVLTKGNKLSLFVLGIVGFALAILGFLMLCVGIVFTTAYTYVIFAVAYLAMSGQATAESLYAPQTPQQPPTAM